jgi:hypothetical protein
MRQRTHLLIVGLGFLGIALILLAMIVRCS